MKSPLHGKALAEELMKRIIPQMEDTINIVSDRSTAPFTSRQLEDIAAIARTVAILAVMEYEDIVRSGQGEDGLQECSANKAVRPVCLFRRRSSRHRS